MDKEISVQTEYELLDDFLIERNGQEEVRYKLGKVLNEGDLSKVWLAENQGRNIVVKLNTSDDKYIRQGFRQGVEILKVASKNNPNIVQYLESGKTKDGVDVLLTGYYPGSDLGNLPERRGELPIKSVLYLGKEIARTLAALHEEQYIFPDGEDNPYAIIHRDIKPGNILLRSENVFDGMVISDFGFATKAKNGIFVPTYEEGNDIFCTANYAAPEVSKNQPYRTKSDVFALGVTLYELLTNKMPFAALTDEDTLRQIIGTGHEDVRKIRPEIPENLNNLINKMLIKYPEDRPSSKKVAHELEKMYYEMR